MSKESLDSLLDSISFIRVGFAVAQRVQDANSWSQLPVSAWLFCGFTSTDPECVPRSSVRLMGQQLSIKTDNCQEVPQRRERKTRKGLSLWARLQILKKWVNNKNNFAVHFQVPIKIEFYGGLYRANKWSSEGWEHQISMEHFFGIGAHGLKPLPWS